jgi:GTP-binding protein YchF
VGKSTLFNALTAGRAEVSNYPFTTIDSNLGMVVVPEPRLEQIAQVLEPQKITPCTIQFIDIAGLVKGASSGEGLGNQFLGEIRQVDVIAHVLRCFTRGEVAHVFDHIDPLRDAEVVETELILADLEVLERAISKRQKQWQTHPQEHVAERSRMLAYKEWLEQGRPLRHRKLDEHDHRWLKTAGLLTGRPVMYVANAADRSEAAPLQTLLEHDSGAEIVTLDVDLERELQELPADERSEFMAELGLAASGLDQVVRCAFSLLGLVTFFTVAKGKLQAWEVLEGTLAPAAAGKVHSDMERGFIRAKMVPAAELCEHGSLAEVQQAGLVRTVGKDYVVQDGDVLEFFFSP